MANQAYAGGGSKGGLTLFAKTLIGLLIIGAVGFAAWKYLPEGDSKDPLRVHLITYPGTRLRAAVRHRPASRQNRLP